MSIDIITALAAIASCIISAVNLYSTYRLTKYTVQALTIWNPKSSSSMPKRKLIGHFSARHPSIWQTLPQKIRCG